MDELRKIDKLAFLGTISLFELSILLNIIFMSVDLIKAKNYMDLAIEIPVNLVIVIVILILARRPLLSNSVFKAKKFLNTFIAVIFGAFAISAIPQFAMNPINFETSIRFGFNIFFAIIIAFFALFQIIKGPNKIAVYCVGAGISLYGLIDFILTISLKGIDVFNILFNLLFIGFGICYIITNLIFDYNRFSDDY